MATFEEKTDATELIASTSSPTEYGSIPLRDSMERSQPLEEISVRALFREMNWRKKLIVITASLVNFSSLCCFAIMAPFLPLESASKGMGSTAVGIILASFELTMFVTSVVFGRYLTSIGARFMYICGIMVASSCSILFGMLQWCPPGSVFIGIAIACRVVEAIGCSMSQTASMAIVANEFQDRVSTVMGVMETFSGLGLMAGPPIGGALYEIGGFYLPFVVIGIFFAITGVIAAFILPKSIVVAPKDRGKLFRSFIKIPTVLVCGFSVMTCATMIAFLDPILSNQLVLIDTSFANSATLIGLVFLVEPALYSIFSPLSGYLADILKYPLLLMAIGNVGLIFAFLLIGPSPLLSFIPTKLLWLTIVAFGLVGCFYGFCFVTPFAVVTKAAMHAGLANDLDLYGLIAGCFNSVFYLGTFFGPLLGGFLAEHYGFEWATTIITLVPFLDVIVLAAFAILAWQFHLF